MNPAIRTERRGRVLDMVADRLRMGSAERARVTGKYRALLGVSTENVIDDDVGLECGDQHEAVKHQESCRTEFHEGLEFERRCESFEEFSYCSHHDAAGHGCVRP